MASSWQKTKLKRKTGERRKELETHFGIKSLVKEVKEEIMKDPKMFEKLKDTPKKTTKKKSK